MELVRVTDLKQWGYCPRVVYYQRTMPGVARPTHKMEEGKAAQEMVESLELRRTLREYGMEGMQRRFGVWLESEQAGLAGKLDLLLEGERGAAVVEFKLTSGEPAENHRLQLAGYAVLVEEAAGLPVLGGFWYRIPDGRIWPIAITGELRQRVREGVAAIRGLAETQWCPEPTGVRQRCVECEYANYCGDVW
jgi:CRISPR-associated exonuclease Cas4